MKVTLDLDKLLEEDHITQEEYHRLSRFAARGTSVLAFNLLIGFGVVAVSGAALALLPSPVTAIVLGLSICSLGVGLLFLRRAHWKVLANICILVGALLFGGGAITAGEGSPGSFLLVAAVYATAGILARSSLLAVLCVLALASCLGARTGYYHAAYFLGTKEPAWTVVLFTAFSIGIYHLSKRIPAAYQPMAVVGSRTGVFLVNLGFWIGSLWGDRILDKNMVIPDWIFALLWALALLTAGIWAWRRNLRTLLNIAAVFGAIHFYTQWFERLGASAEAVLIAGLLALGFAFGLKALNTRLGRSE
ncbi:MAG: hypothetical protein ACLFSY_10375 [Desulfonatronovibrionaceae bacterium]